MIEYISTHKGARRTLEFHAYAAEEVGLLGSLDISTKYANENKKVYSYLNFDMTGHHSTDEVAIISDYTDPDLNDFLEMIITTYVGTFTRALCYYGCSDHASWHGNYFPAAFTFETHFSSLNPNIHQSADTVDNLDFDHSAKFVKIAIASAVELLSCPPGVPTEIIQMPPSGSSYVSPRFPEQHLPSYEYLPIRYYTDPQYAYDALIQFDIEDLSEHNLNHAYITLDVEATLTGVCDLQVTRINPFNESGVAFNNVSEGETAGVIQTTGEPGFYEIDVFDLLHSALVEDASELALTVKCISDTFSMCYLRSSMCNVVVTEKS